MEAINYAPDGQNMILTDDAQIVPGISGNACYLPAGTGKIALTGNRNELSLSLWRQWDGIVEQYAPRGLFSFENIQVFFDSVSDFLTVVINDFKTMTDIKDDQKQAHWCFTFIKNGRFTIYKNAKEVYSLVAGNKPVDPTDGFTLGGGFTHATFDEVRIYKTVLTQGEINGLFYLISKGTQVKQLESMIPAHTPKYLGVTKTVLTTRTAFIIKGEKLGTQDANPGDWVLMDKTVGGWKCGVCYRWTGSMWINLEPEYNYIEQYQAALYHICEIPELMKNTGHFGALFAKVLVAQKALIDKLVAQEAFIKKLIAQEAFIKQLATEQAFLKKLIVQKLHIDSDPNSHQDFEAWFDETNGLKRNNRGQEIFKVDTAGNVFAKNATLIDAYFSGNIVSGPLELLNSEPSTQKITLVSNSTATSIVEKYGVIDIICENINGGTPVHRFITMAIPFTTRVPIYEWDYSLIPPKMVFKEWKIVSGVTNTVQFFTNSGDKTYTNNETITEDYILSSKKGVKTFKLKNIPTVKPVDKNIVWVDSSGCLRLS